MKSETFNCQKAKEIDLVHYLYHMGYSPKKIRNHDYWYFSPFRNEKVPSFKVNQKLNVWFDHGDGTGGTIVDFGIRYYHCSVSAFLLKLEKETNKSFLVHPPLLQKRQAISSKIMITDCRKISDPALRQYLYQRNIPVLIANQFCSEIEFELYGKKCLAIGFKNDAGGYELRSETFKGSSCPKSITWIKNDPDKVCVFEGFFDFLSFQTVLLTNKERVHKLPKYQDSYIILNSLAFIVKYRQQLEQHECIQLYLDRDSAGVRLTREALERSVKYRDKSHWYAGFKDFNEFHIAFREIRKNESRAYKNQF